MLEVDAENDWWDEMPDSVRADVEAALAEADRGELIPHKEIKKCYILVLAHLEKRGVMLAEMWPSLLC